MRSKTSRSSEGVPETSSSLTALPTAASGDNSLPSLSYQPQSPPIPLRRLIRSTHTCTLAGNLRGFGSAAKPAPHLMQHSYTHTHTHTHIHAVAHQKPMHQKHTAEYFPDFEELSSEEETFSPSEKVSRN